MEPEGSSPHSQAPATCPYPEPAQSSPHTLIPPPEGPYDARTHVYKIKKKKSEIAQHYNETWETLGEWGCKSNHAVCVDILWGYM